MAPPTLGPISSAMGEIMLISMTSTQTSPMALRSLADWVIRPRLLGVPGVSQVSLVGLRAEDLAETVEVAPSGHVASQVLQEQWSYDIIVRLDDAARQSVDAMRRTLIDTSSGARVPLGQVAEVVDFRDAIVQGSLERLSPILMTALVAGIGLVPLALGAGQPGKEIQPPMTVVILGGLAASTALNMIVMPALYLRYGRVGARRRREEPAVGVAAIAE